MIEFVLFVLLIVAVVSFCWMIKEAKDKERWRNLLEKENWEWYRMGMKDATLQYTPALRKTKIMDYRDLCISSFEEAQKIAGCKKVKFLISGNQYVLRDFVFFKIIKHEQAIFVYWLKDGWIAIFENGEVVTSEGA